MAAHAADIAVPLQPMAPSPGQLLDAAYGSETEARELERQAARLL
jgi:hypothetical protein